MPAKCEYTVIVALDKQNLLAQEDRKRFYLSLDIIHAVGPKDKDPAVLESAYLNSLNLTEKHSIKSIVSNYVVDNVGYKTFYVYLGSL